MKTIKVGDRVVGIGEPTFIIAEAGINHNGDLDIAKRMVHAAREVGVDAIKFQTFTAESLMTRSAGAAAHLEAGAGKENVYSFAQRLALSPEAHRELFTLCQEVGILFLSTAGAPEGVDLLEELGVSAYKIASMDLDNLPLLDYIARIGKPIILSTGMGTLGEIERALETIYATDNEQVIVLHCTALYPPTPEDVNLRAMDTIRAAFNVAVGYSDHTIGNAVAIAAVARGACVIEKHFTLDKNMPGPDQAVSGDPEDFHQLVADIQAVETALGSAIKQPVQAELGMRRNFRRSIVAAMDIAAGAVLTRDMLTFKRPGSGISPADLDWVVGRTARRAISADTVIEHGDLV